MSGNADSAYPRKLTIEFTLEVDTYGHYHEINYSVDHPDLSWPELDTPLANHSHIEDVGARMNTLLDKDEEYQSRSWNGERYSEGTITVRPGVTVWRAPPNLPHDLRKKVFLNAIHEEDGISMDAQTRAHRNAHRDAQEL